MTHPDARILPGWADRPWWVLLILLPGLWALLIRPLAPLDETRVAGVAWEMWRSGDFLVPHMNGLPYSHKPPLLLWLLHLGWAVFGVNDWWPRLVGPLVTLAATALSVRLAREMWPGERTVRSMAGWLLAGSLGWLAYGQMLMYDTLLTTCVLLALIGAWRVGSGAAHGGWLLLACGVGLGILAKGPVVLVHVLPVLLLGPLWSERARQGLAGWYGKSSVAVLGGLLIAGLWAIPAATAGGEDYARAILLQQTSGRLVQSFAHQRSWWAYLAFVPVLALPWILLPRSWRVLAGGDDAGSRRFLMCWVLGGLVILSLVSGKQPHYAVPELPAVMLLIARGLAAPGAAKRTALQAIGFVLLALTLASIAFIRLDLGDEFDMKPAGDVASALQGAGIPLATSLAYKDQLTFAGRLERPLTMLDRSELREWLRRNPQGVVITFAETLPDSLGLVEFERFPYRRKQLQFLRASDDRSAD